MTGSDSIVKQCADTIMSASLLRDRMEAADVMVALIEVQPYNILTALQELSGVTLSMDERDLAKEIAFRMAGDQPSMLAQAESWQQSPELARFGSALVGVLGSLSQHGKEA